MLDQGASPDDVVGPSLWQGLVSSVFAIDIDTPPIKALRARLALMPESLPDDPDFVPAPAQRVKYKHKPTVEQVAAAKQLVLHRPGGITKWLDDRQQALKASDIKVIEAKFLREQLAEKRVADANYRARLHQEKVEKAKAEGKPEPMPRPLSDGVLRKIQAGRDAAANELDSRKRVAKRIQMFEHRGGPMADRWYDPFVEKITREDGSTTGLRSWNGSISTALFASRLPKVHRLEWGDDKRKLHRYDLTQRKIFVLDCPYICLDPKRLGCLVVDLDTSWESEEALLDAVRGVVGAERMPNLVVFRWSLDGTQLERPHLLWLLPPKHKNGNDGAVGTGGKSNQGFVQFFKAVQRALVAKMIPLGADIGHHNSQKVKNPLSPFWNLLIDDSNFVSLSEWNRFLPMNISEEEITRQAAVCQVAAEANATIERSNHGWTTVYELQLAARTQAMKSNDRAHADAKRSYGAYYDWLMAQIKDKAIAALGAGKLTDALLHKQVTYRANHRRARLQTEVKNRGRDRLLNQSTPKKTKKAKRQTAGSNTRASQLDTSINLVADFVRQLVISSQELDKTKVCNTIKTVSRSTAYKVYDFAVQLVRDAIRYTAKPTPQSNGPSSQLPRVNRPARAIPAKKTAIPAKSSNRAGLPPWLPAFLGREYENYALYLTNRIKLDAESGKNHAAAPPGPPATRSNPDPSGNPIATPRATVSHGIRPHGQSIHARFIHDPVTVNNVPNPLPTSVHVHSPGNQRTLH